MLIQLLRTELGEEVKHAFEVVVRLMLRFYGAPKTTTDLSSAFEELYRASRDSMAKGGASWISRVCWKHAILIVFNEIRLSTLTLAQVLDTLAIALGIGVHIHVAQTALRVRHGEHVRLHSRLQRVAGVVHERELVERHVIHAGLEVRRGLDRAHVLLAAHLGALHVHHHVLLLVAELDGAAVGTHVLAEGDADLRVRRHVELVVLGRDHQDERLLVVYA